MTPINRTTTLLLVALGSLSLTGCKGGGGGNGPTTSTQTPTPSVVSESVTQTSVTTPVVVPEEQPQTSSSPAEVIQEDPATSNDTASDETEEVILPAVLWEDDSQVKSLVAESVTVEQPMERGKLISQRMRDVTAQPATQRLYLTSLNNVGISDSLIEQGGVLMLDADTLSPLGHFQLWQKIVSMAFSTDSAYTQERYSLKINVHDVVDPALPVLLGSVASDTVSTVITDDDGTAYYHTKNDLKRITLNDANEPQAATVTTLNSLALGQITDLAKQDNALYSIKRELTPGVTHVFRAPEEDMKYYQRWIFAPEKTNKAIQALPAGQISADVRTEYAALGSDIATAPYDRDDLLLAQVLEQDKLPLSQLQLMFSSNYLERSLVDSVQVTDLANPTSTTALLSKPGQIIQDAAVQEQHLILTLIDNLAANTVDTLEVYDLTQPLSPQLQQQFAITSYPTLVSEHTVFGTQNNTPVAYSLRKIHVSGKDRYQVRLFDLTTTQPVKVIGEATLPKDVVATSLTVDGERIFIGTEKQEIFQINLYAFLE